MMLLIHRVEILKPQSTVVNRRLPSSTLPFAVGKWRWDMAEQRKIALFAEVHKVVRYLHDEGKCPTADRVTSLLSPTASKEWRTANAAVKAARHAIENGRCSPRIEHAHFTASTNL